MRIMIDIETMGTAPGSAIVSIGAVKFNDEAILDTFYRRISLQSCLDYGLTMDAETVLWWMQENSAPRLEMVRDGQVGLYPALKDLSAFVAKDGAEIWGNGSDFDNALLQEAYRRVKLRLPWGYKQNRCYRTMKNLFPMVKASTGGVKHNALDDATNQAQHLIEILKFAKRWMPQ